MDRTFIRILLLLSWSAAFGKYIYIKEKKHWPGAQSYCREFHTDLAPVSSAHDIKHLRRVVTDTTENIWIGLIRNLTDREKWTWSGGGEVSTRFWAQNEPNDKDQEEHYGMMRNFSWYDVSFYPEFTFVCYNPVVVLQKMTWEEALDYCRENHNDLASVASDTEMSLIQRKLGKYYMMDFWIGLHFFPRHWLWVDGQSLHYEAWGQGGKPACPVLKQCGALRVMGRPWRSNNTASTLLTSTTTGGFSASLGTIYATTGILGESDPAVRVWEALRCEEKLPFICY